MWKKRSHSFKNNVDEWEGKGTEPLLSSCVCLSILIHLPPISRTKNPYSSPLRRKRYAWVFLSTFERRRRLTPGACMRRDSCFILRAPSRNCIARTAAAWWIATRRHFRRRRLVDQPPDRFSLIGNISRDRFLPPDFATTITSVQPTTTHILTAASIYHTLTPTTHHPLNIARAIADYYESRLQPWCIVWLMRKQWKCATTAVKSRTV